MWFVAVARLFDCSGAQSVSSATDVRSTFVLSLECDEDELVKRLRARERGPDDRDSAAIERRLESYRTKSRPIIDKLASEAPGAVVRVDAGQDKEKVFDDICQELHKRHISRISDI